MNNVTMKLRRRQAFLRRGRLFEVPDKLETVELVRLIDEVYGNTVPDDTVMAVVDIDSLITAVDLWMKELPMVALRYAVKCNSNPILLDILTKLGIGFDCASEWEMEQILNRGISPNQIIAAHTQKSHTFLRYLNQSGVILTIADSVQEMEKIALLHPGAEILIRLRPQKMPTFISFKFGATENEASSLVSVANRLNLKLRGVHFHVGIKTRDVTEFDRLFGVARGLLMKMREEGHLEANLVDMGGGFPPNFDDFCQLASQLRPLFLKHFDDMPAIQFYGEPGRFIAEGSVHLVSTVVGVRSFNADSTESNEVLMNYFLNDGAFGNHVHNALILGEILPQKLRYVNPDVSTRPQTLACLYGPTCAGPDVLLENEYLPQLLCGDKVIFCNSGAYSINSNTHFNGLHDIAYIYTATKRTIQRLQLHLWRRPELKIISKYPDILNERADGRMTDKLFEGM